MPRQRSRWALLIACGLLSCSGEQQSPDAGDGIAVADTCDSAEAAAGNDSCRLSLDQEKQGFISPQDDVDWYVLDVPEPLPDRALLTVRAEYRVPSTPVTLVVNLLKADGRSSIGSATDPRERGEPGPAQVVARLQPPIGPGAGRYFVVVSHDSASEDPAADRRNPYYLTAKLVSDPDLNEPNDETPTPIALPACGTATAQGALSTSGDSDLFSFDLQPCSGRTLLHLALRSPGTDAGIRLDYELQGPAGVIATDHAANPYTEQRLVTVRLAQAGSYTLRVRAYKASNETRDPPGDPGFTYTVALSLFPDADQNEGPGGNDDTDNATGATLSVGGQPRTFTGRLSYVGDQDWFEVPSVAVPSRLHYRLRYSSAPGRFEAVPTMQPRELEAVTLMPTSACRATCPNGGAESASWCSRGQCLQTLRVEAAELAFGNFEGQLQFPAGAGSLFLKVGYEGAEGADDQEYTLELRLIPDTADEASGPHSRENAIPVRLPAGQATVLGHGRGEASVAPAPNGLTPLPRGPLDYDAESDSDFYEMSFDPLPPPALPDGGLADAGVDHALTIAWLIPPGDGGHPGERPLDLGLRLHFCADRDCSQVVTTRGFLGYSAAKAQVWYPTTDLGLDGGLGLQTPYTLDQNAGRFSMTSAMCACIDASYAAAGRFWVEIRAVDRASYADTPVQVLMSVGPYPPTVADDEGRRFTCPTPCQWVAKSIE